MKNKRIIGFSVCCIALSSVFLWALFSSQSTPTAESVAELTDQEKKAIAEFFPEPAAGDPTSGFTLIHKAAFAYNKDSEPKGSPSSLNAELSPEEDLRLQRATVERNQEALALIQKAIKLDSIAAPPDRIDKTDFKTSARLRDLARLVAQQRAVYEADAKYLQAAQTSLDTVEMGQKVLRQGSIMSCLGNISIGSVGLFRFHRIVPHLSGPEARIIAERMQKLQGERFTVARALEQERKETSKYHQQFFQSPEWKAARNAKSWSDIPKDNNVFSSEKMWQETRKFSDAELLAAQVAIYDEIIPRFKNHNGRVKGAKVPADPYNKSLNEFYTGTDIGLAFIEARQQAAYNLNLTAVAIRAFGAEKGCLPTSLQQLVEEKYLAEVPRDSFSNQPLKYKRGNDKYVLHSVGPDQKDDGGRAIESYRVFDAASGQYIQKKTSRVMESSRGDMVWGTNR